MDTHDGIECLVAITENVMACLERMEAMMEASQRSRWGHTQSWGQSTVAEH
jgi:hypothetical protein